MSTTPSTFICHCTRAFLWRSVRSSECFSMRSEFSSLISSKEAPGLGCKAWVAVWVMAWQISSGRFRRKKERISPSSKKRITVQRKSSPPRYSPDMKKLQCRTESTVHKGALVPRGDSKKATGKCVFSGNEMVSKEAWAHSSSPSEGHWMHAYLSSPLPPLVCLLCMLHSCLCV